MRLTDPVKISIRNLVAAKFRSFLTILGIIIGVASVIVIMAIGQSAQALIIDQVQGVGSNLIGILPGASDEKGPPAAALGIVTTTLSYDDLLALRDPNRNPDVESGAAYVLGNNTVNKNNNNLNLSVIGTTASYIKVENAEVESGRFFTQDEESNLSRVAVLGFNSARELFSNDNPINQKIQIKKQGYTVIGILKKRGSSGFGVSSPDDSVIVPLKTTQKLLLGINHLGFVRLKARSADAVPYVVAQSKIILRERHNIRDPVNDDFSVRDQASAVVLISNITDALRYFLLAVGSMSLIVGGVGIMNVMLIAVNQRIREVGLRKAVGAKNKNILAQFLIESASISFIGGLAGILLGITFSLLIAIVAQALGYAWPFLISWQSILVASLVSISIGFIFGIYPARRASRVSPMEALRYE